MTRPAQSETAIEFLSVAVRGDVREAFSAHVADSSVRHTADFSGDHESLLLATEHSAATEQNKRSTVKQVIAAGDRGAVLTHLQRAAADSECAVVHILRIENGLIVEMWDLAQEIPKSSPNPRGNVLSAKVDSSNKTTLLRCAA